MAHRRRARPPGTLRLWATASPARARAIGGPSAHGQAKHQRPPRSIARPTCRSHTRRSSPKSSACSRCRHAPRCSNRSFLACCVRASPYANLKTARASVHSDNPRPSGSPTSACPCVYLTAPSRFAQLHRRACVFRLRRGSVTARPPRVLPVAHHAPLRLYRRSRCSSDPVARARDTRRLALCVPPPAARPLLVQIACIMPRRLASQCRAA
jgi:hypothetical protein